MLDPRSEGSFSFDQFKKFITNGLNLAFVDSKNIVDLYSSYQSSTHSKGCKVGQEGFVEMLLPYDGSFSARLLHVKTVAQLNDQSVSCLKEVFS